MRFLFRKEFIYRKGNRESQELSFPKIGGRSTKLSNSLKERFIWKFEELDWLSRTNNKNWFPPQRLPKTHPTPNLHPNHFWDISHEMSNHIIIFCAGGGVEWGNMRKQEQCWKRNQLPLPPLNQPNFQFFSTSVTLKIRWRSPNSVKAFIMSDLYINENLVRIQPLVHKILCS